MSNANRKGKARAKGNPQSASSSRIADLVDPSAVNLFRANPALAFDQLLNQGSSQTSLPTVASSRSYPGSYATSAKASDGGTTASYDPLASAYHMDGELALLLKKLTKRHPASRIKALEELRDYINAAPVQKLEPLTAAWPRLYEKNTIEIDRRLRIMANQVNAALVARLERRIATALPTLLPFWLLSFFDPAPEAAQSARAAFEILFKPDKRAKALHHYADTVLDFVARNLSQCTPDTLVDADAMSAEDRQVVFERYVAASFRLWAYLLDELPDDTFVNHAEACHRILANPDVWQRFQHPSPVIRRAAYATLTQFLQRRPGLLEEYQRLIGHAFVRKAVMDRDVSTHRDLWDALLLTTKHYPRTWVFANEKKPVLPKLYDFVAHGGYGSPRALADSLSVLVRLWPSEVTDANLAGVANGLMGAFTRGARIVAARPADLSAYVACWCNCLPYFIGKLAKAGEELQAGSLLVTQTQQISRLCLLDQPSEAGVRELSTLAATLAKPQFPRGFADMAANALGRLVLDHLAAQEEGGLSLPEQQTLLERYLVYLTSLQDRRDEAGLHEKVPGFLEELGLAFVRRIGPEEDEMEKEADKVKVDRDTEALRLLAVILERRGDDLMARPTFTRAAEHALLRRLNKFRTAPQEPSADHPLFAILATFALVQWRADPAASLAGLSLPGDDGSGSEGPGSGSLVPFLVQVLDCILTGTNRNRQAALLEPFLAQLVQRWDATTDPGRLVPQRSAALAQFLDPIASGGLAPLGPTQAPTACRLLAHCLLLGPAVLDPSLEIEILHSFAAVVDEFTRALLYDTEPVDIPDPYLVESVLRVLPDPLASPRLCETLLRLVPECLLVPRIFDLAALDSTLHAVGNRPGVTDGTLYAQLCATSELAERCRQRLVATCGHTDDGRLQDLLSTLRTGLTNHLHELLWDPATTANPYDLGEYVQFLVRAVCTDETERQLVLHTILHRPSDWSAILRDCFARVPNAAVELHPFACMDSYLCGHRSLLTPATFDAPAPTESAANELPWVRLVIVTSELARQLGITRILFSPCPQAAASVPNDRHGDDDAEDNPCGTGDCQINGNETTPHRLLPTRLWIVHAWLLGWVVNQDEELSYPSAMRSFPSVDTSDGPWSDLLSQLLAAFMHYLLRHAVFPVTRGDSGTYCRADPKRMRPEALFAFTHAAPESSPDRASVTGPEDALSALSFRTVQAFYHRSATLHLRTLTALWRYACGEVMGSNPWKPDSPVVANPTRSRVSFNPTVEDDGQVRALEAWLREVAAQFDRRLDPYVYLALIQGFPTTKPQAAAIAPAVSGLRRRCLDGLQALTAPDQDLMATLADPDLYDNLITGLAAVVYLLGTTVRREAYETSNLLRLHRGGNADFQRDLTDVYAVLAALGTTTQTIADRLAADYTALDAEGDAAALDWIRTRAGRLLLVTVQCTKLAYPFLRHLGADSTELVSYLCHLLGRWLCFSPERFGLASAADGPSHFVSGLLRDLWGQGIFLTHLILGRLEHNLGYVVGHRLPLPPGLSDLLQLQWDYFLDQPLAAAGEDTTIDREFMNSASQLSVTALRLGLLARPQLDACLARMDATNGKLIAHLYFISRIAVKDTPMDAGGPPVLTALRRWDPMACRLMRERRYVDSTDGRDLDPDLSLFRNLVLYNLFLTVLDQKTATGTPAGTGSGSAVSLVEVPTQAENRGLFLRRLDPASRSILDMCLDTLRRLLTLAFEDGRPGARPFPLSPWDPATFYLSEFDGGRTLSYSLYAAHLLYRSLRLFPTFVRLWWENMVDRGDQQATKSFVTMHYSPALIREELERVDHDPRLMAVMAKYENLKVRTNRHAGTCTLRFLQEDVTVELVFRLPTAYPLQTPEIECQQRSVITEPRWRGWTLTNHALALQNARFADQVYHFAHNIAYMFEGVEECYICFSVVCIREKVLPNRPCSTCHKKFHSACLEKWFRQSRNRNCPMCRSEM
ncbi:hypothetical protein IWQ60_005524 [Tieghemiomyces parasiticus]|uniref:E3 ubiquitin-protein ligase listerin n=1 Tax=Tieghemiomyces parasiticus TaxID=78921 RepID=A0A9W8A5Y5_9FUNG|nr:hypothetical protein IWQ60_005524 [Tieghemiomyces parasiticus]